MARGKPVEPDPEDDPIDEDDGSGPYVGGELASELTDDDEREWRVGLGLDDPLWDDDGDDSDSDDEEQDTHEEEDS